MHFCWPRLFVYIYTLSVSGWWFIKLCNAISDPEPHLLIFCIEDQEYMGHFLWIIWFLFAISSKLIILCILFRKWKSKFIFHFLVINECLGYHYLLPMSNENFCKFLNDFSLTQLEDYEKHKHKSKLIKSFKELHFIKPWLKKHILSVPPIKNYCVSFYFMMK